MAAKKKDETVEQPELTAARRKVNRGSTRRINRAFAILDEALTAFAKEIDTQAFMADADGNRVEDHYLVKGVKQIQDEIRLEVAKITNPEPAVEEEAELVKE